MKKSQLEKIAILPLLLVFGFMLWRGYKYIKPEGEVKSSKQIVNKKKILVVSEDKKIKGVLPKKKEDKKAKIKTREKFDYLTIKYQPIERDPFRSPLDILKTEMSTTATETEIKLPTMNLQGWTWGYQPRAIINDQVVEKGDKVSGAEVLEIRKEGVILIYQGKVFTVRSKR